MSKYQLKKTVKELSEKRGRNTELVSLYIPAGYDISKISNFITSEKSEAENIKSKQTRKNVQAALDKIGRRLKEVQQTPENGVAFFCGNVSEREGRPDIQIWEIVPPQPIESRRYRCDKEFVTQPLEQMVVNDNVYGLIVADKNEAAIGYLQGNHVKTAYTMESNVPGKTRAGGQCLDPDSVIQMSNGELKKLKNVEVGDYVKAADFGSMRLGDSKVIDKWEEEKEVYRIETKFPGKTIVASKDHEVFVTTNGVEKKAVEELKEGEKLIFPQEINTQSKEEILNSESLYNAFKISEKGRKKIQKTRKELNLYQKQLGEQINSNQAAISKIELGERDVKRDYLQKLCNELNLDFQDFVREYCRGKKYHLPRRIDQELGEILGYFTGDGSFENQRINFHESDKEVAEYYQEKLESKFNCNTEIKFREDKNYYRVRAYGKPIVKYIKHHFPEIKKSRTSEIPSKILKSDEALRGFVRGLYDAEGHCSESRKRVGISVNNKILSTQLQSALLRYNIISSRTVYDNSQNPYSNNKRYTLSISDQESIQKFKEQIGFNCSRKQEELEKTTQYQKSKNKSRQVLTQGSEIRKRIEEEGMTMEDFKSANGYLQDKRNISKEAFERNLIEESEGELRKDLKKIHNSQLLPTQIKSIEKLEKQKTIDISVEAGNFVANNLVVHNSAQRFERIRKEMYKTFMKEIAEKSKNAFLPKKREGKLLGIILGGPGFTKDKIVEDGYLHQELEEELITTESLNYSGEDALEKLVEKAEDSIEDSEVVKEKKLVTEFFTNLKEENGKAEYGLKHVLKALKMGAVEKLLISENIDLYHAEYKCENEHTEEIFEEKPEIEENINCDECGQEMELQEISDIIDVLAEKAEEMSSDLEIIGTEHEEGERLSNMTGIAAILRYRIR